MQQINEQFKSNNWLPLFGLFDVESMLDFTGAVSYSKFRRYQTTADKEEADEIRASRKGGLKLKKIRELVAQNYSLERIVFETGFDRSYVRAVMIRDGKIEDTGRKSALYMPVIVMNMAGQELCKFDTIKECAEKMNLISTKHIRECCNGIRVSYKGMMFKYDPENMHKVERIKYRTLITNKPVLQIVDGEVVREFDSVVIAADELGLKKEVVYRCCSWKSKKTHHGCTFRFKGDIS